MKTKISLLFCLLFFVNSAFAANFKEVLSVDGVELLMDTSANFSPAFSVSKQGKAHAGTMAGWYLRAGHSGPAVAIQIFKHLSGAKIKSTSKDQVVFEWTEDSGWTFNYSVKLIKKSTSIVMEEELNVVHAPVQDYRITYSARTEPTYFPLASVQVKSPRVELVYKNSAQTFVFEIQSVVLDKTLDKLVGTPVSDDLPKITVQGKGAQFWAETQDLDLFLWLDQRVALEGDLVPNSQPWVSTGFFSAFNYGFQWNQSNSSKTTVVTEYLD